MSDVTKEEIERIRRDYPASAIQGDLHKALTYAAALEAQLRSAQEEVERGKVIMSQDEARHAKALVRARNEGVEKVAMGVGHSPPCDDKGLCGPCETAARIRAMKEPES